MNELRKCKHCGRELPVEQMQRNQLGVTHVCKECRKKRYNETIAKRRENKTLEAQLAEAKTLRLQDFTPRELMQELKRRGYEGKLTYTEVHTVDLSKEF